MLGYSPFEAGASILPMALMLVLIAVLGSVLNSGYRDHVAPADGGGTGMA